MVTRHDAVQKILNNEFLTATVLASVAEVIATELNAVADNLEATGDDFSQIAGLRLAAKIVANKHE